MSIQLGDYFSKVEDPRSLRNQKHPFMMLIGTTLLAFLSGIDSFSGIFEFAEAHQDNLEKYFEFPYGAPSHDTYQRLWSAINPEQFKESFILFTESIAKIAEQYSVLSLDGKTIRNSGKEKPLHLVSAWCEANEMVLGQQKVDNKSNEITAIPKLLDILDLEERIITIDAMGAQRDICNKILLKGGYYVISLKGNQGNVHNEVKEYFGDSELQKLCHVFKEVHKGHGRIEIREAYVTDDIDWLQRYNDWPGLKSIGMVISTVQKKGKTTSETRYYISSLHADARLISKAARTHWGIENKLHWRLDVVFNEDKCCIRNDNAAENVDILRKWALNILQKAKEKPEQSIKSLMRKNAMSFKHLSKNLQKIFLA